MGSQVHCVCKVPWCGCWQRVRSLYLHSFRQAWQLINNQLFLQLYCHGWCVVTNGTGHRNFSLFFNRCECTILLLWFFYILPFPFEQARICQAGFYLICRKIRDYRTTRPSQRLSFFTKNKRYHILCLYYHIRKPLSCVVWWPIFLHL